MLSAAAQAGQIRAGCDGFAVMMGSLGPTDIRKLKIARIPTPPSALIVGNYWSCTIHDDREICKITLVVCTDDQSQCVEV